jgi:hypothetical protein
VTERGRQFEHCTCGDRQCRIVVAAFPLCGHEPALSIFADFAQRIAVEPAQRIAADHLAAAPQLGRAVAEQTAGHACRNAPPGRVRAGPSHRPIAASRASICKKLERGDLMIQIEVGERLIEQIQLRRLRQQGGDRQSLPLATGKRLHIALARVPRDRRRPAPGGRSGHPSRIPNPSGQDVGDVRPAPSPVPSMKMPRYGSCGNQPRMTRAGARAQIGVARFRRAALHPLPVRRRPASTDSSVDLPAPLRPRMARHSPGTYGQGQLAAEDAVGDADAQIAAAQERGWARHLSADPVQRGSAEREKPARRSAR